MSLRASLTAKVVTTLADGKFKIGTAYPIRPGVVLTAYHVIPGLPDPGNCCNTRIKWPNISDEDGEPLNSPVEEVLYTNQEADLVILACKTPPELPVVEVCRYPADSTASWDSFGYADAGIVMNVRKEVPAGGTYYHWSDVSHELHMQVKGDAAATNLWRGMSGAPVFTVGSNQLTAVITKVPDDENPDFKDRIYATSLAWLFYCKDSEFEKAISITDHCRQYLERQQSALFGELQSIKEKSPAWFGNLAKQFSASATAGIETLEEDMLDDFRTDPVQCIEKLRLVCEPYMHSNREYCELLLLRVLACHSSADQWPGHHLHDFKVRTRLLCELKVAARYQVDPRLKRLKKGDVVGIHAIEDHSAREVGFDPESNALEQARSIAHYIYRRLGEEDEFDDITEDDWQGICTELSTRRKGIRPELIRFELDARKEKAHPLVSEEVRRELYKLLPELPVVLFGLGSQADEKALRAQVKVFYERLDNL